MAGIVADYAAVRVDRVRLRSGADASRTLEFGLPAATSTRFPMVLTFLLVSSHDLQLRIELNGTVVSDRRYTNGPERVIQDLVSDVVLPFGRRSAVTFTVVQGEVLLSDVVLWFQRNAEGGNDVVGGGFDVDGIDLAVIHDPPLITADYVAAKAGRVRLAVGADTDRTVEVDLPDRALSGRPMLLTFLLVSSNDLHLRIDLNGVLVSDRRYATAAERCIQELALGVPVVPRTPNRLVLTALQGEVLLRDVVLWFQRRG